MLTTRQILDLREKEPEGLLAEIIGGSDAS
jgi:hypothetical protein